MGPLAPGCDWSLPKQAQFDSSGRSDSPARLQRLRSPNSATARHLLLPGSPRRAHSFASRVHKRAKNSRTTRFGGAVYETIRAAIRGALTPMFTTAQVSVNIIDQCVAQGVPFAREYGGVLANRSFGGAQVSRTFYARGQTGQQLLLGAYQALERMIGQGSVTMYSRHEMLDVVVVDGHARGIIAATWSAAR